MIKRVLKFEYHILRRYTEQNVKGVIQQTLLFEKSILGAIMPADLTEFSEMATNIAVIEKEGFRITDYKNFYSPSPNQIQLFDYVEENGNPAMYKVIRVYDYRKYGFLGKHTKVVLAELS